MKRKFFVWSLALLLTLVSAFWQELSGPTRKIRVRSEVGGIPVSGKLLRTHSINGDLPVALTVAGPEAGNPGLQGTVIWRRYPTDDPWQRVPMVFEDGQLKTSLPRQPMAGKLEYTVELKTAAGAGTEAIAYFPPREKGPAVARFKGDVPAVVLIFHVSCMILGIFFSTATGLEALTRGPGLKRLTRLAFGFLTVGGLILGPVVQKYAFDAFWTGWPLGQDWTDNKLAVGALVWLIAMILAGRSSGRREDAAAGIRPVHCSGATRWSAVLAMVVILVIYSIPHSIHGSTFDYETGEHVQRM